MVQPKTDPSPRALSRLFSGMTRRPSRSAVLPLMGAVAGLFVAAINLLMPAAAPATAVPPGYVALVNQRPILMNDFISQTETVEGKSFDETTPEQRREVLHGMIDEELLVQRALTLDLPEQDTDVRKQLVDAVTEVLLAQKTPTDDELMAYYTAHRADFETDGSMRYRDIALHIGGFENADQTIDQAMADAHEAIYQLRSGAALDYVMQHFGFVTGTNSDGGTEMDFAAKIHLGEKLFAVAARLGDGEVSEPEVQNDGVHIIIMDERVPPQLADFSAVRQQVYTNYRHDQQLRAEADNLKFLRSNAQILLAAGQSE